MSLIARPFWKRWVSRMLMRLLKEWIRRRPSRRRLRWRRRKVAADMLSGRSDLHDPRHQNNAEQGTTVLGATIHGGPVMSKSYDPGDQVEITRASKRGDWYEVKGVVEGKKVELSIPSPSVERLSDKEARALMKRGLLGTKRMEDRGDR